MAETAAQRPIPRQPADAAIVGLPEDRLRPPPRLSGRNSYSLFASSMTVLLPELAIGLVLLVVAWPPLMPDVSRSSPEERRLGQEWCSTCSSQWSPIQ